MARYPAMATPHEEQARETVRRAQRQLGAAYVNLARAKALLANSPQAAPKGWYDAVSSARISVESAMGNLREIVRTDATAADIALAPQKKAG